MTDLQVLKKMNQICRLCDTLDDEAKRRYGRDGNLFFESEGRFYLMDGDSDGSATERQSHVKVTSDYQCRLGAGAW